MIPILIPLFVSAFRRAEELALAMECRCYLGGEGRTRMKQLHLCGIDFVGLAFVVFCFALTIDHKHPIAQYVLRLCEIYC